MEYYNCKILNYGDFANYQLQFKCMDISTENLVHMDNKRNNLIQHTLIGDSIHVGKKTKDKKDPNEFYNILWKSYNFLKQLGVLRKVYKRLKNEVGSDRKVDFLKEKDKLVREKPLNVMGLKISYSDTSASISEEHQLPTFKEAILTGAMPEELKSESRRKRKRKRLKKIAEEKKKEVEEATIEEEEEIQDIDANVEKPGRTTSSKKDYEKSKRKKMADLRKMYPDPPKIPKRVFKQEEEKLPEPIPEVIHEPEEQPEEAPLEDIEDTKKTPAKPPKPKRRMIKKIKKKQPPPKETPPPPFKLRQPLPTDKRRVSASDAMQKQYSKRGRRRWSYNDRLTHSPSKVDLSPLDIKLPEPKPPPIKLRQPLPTDKRRVSASDAMQKQYSERGRRRWSYNDRLTHSPTKVDLSPLDIKLPEPKHPPFKLRQPLPTDKRRASASDAIKERDRKRERRRWSYDDRLTHSPREVDLSPLDIKLPEPEPPPFKLRKPLPTDKRRASASDALSTKQRDHERRKRRWSYNDKLTHTPSKIDLSPLNVKLPQRNKSIISVADDESGRRKSGRQVGKLDKLYDPKERERQRQLKSVGKLKIPSMWS